MISTSKMTTNSRYPLMNDPWDLFKLLRQRDNGIFTGIPRILQEKLSVLTRGNGPVIRIYSEGQSALEVLQKPGWNSSGRLQSSGSVRDHCGVPKPALFETRKRLGWNCTWKEGADALDEKCMIDTGTHVLLSLSIAYVLQIRWKLESMTVLLKQQREDHVSLRRV